MGLRATCTVLWRNHDSRIRLVIPVGKAPSLFLLSHAYNSHTHAYITTLRLFYLFVQPRGTAQLRLITFDHLIYMAFLYHSLFIFDCIRRWRGLFNNNTWNTFLAIYALIINHNTIADLYIYLTLAGSRCYLRALFFFDVCGYIWLEQIESSSYL